MITVVALLKMFVRIVAPVQQSGGVRYTDKELRSFPLADREE
jgi:hypothetical protein